MRTKKNRPSKRIYLIREISEMWDRLVVLAVLRINKIRAHCLECHDADFTSGQVSQALWKHYGYINKHNGGENPFSAVPEMEGGSLVGLRKIDKSPEGRAIAENERKKALSKSFKRVGTQAEYLITDVGKEIIPKKIARQIINETVIDPTRLLTA